MKSFETFEHGADIGIRGFGESPERALSNLLKALASVMVENDTFLEDKTTISYNIEVEADYSDELLVAFVNKIISLSYSENILFLEFDGEVVLKDRCFIKGSLKGVWIDYDKYGYGVEVKGATFTMAKFEKENEYYIAQCVIDV